MKNNYNLTNNYNKLITERFPRA